MGKCVSACAVGQHLDALTSTCAAAPAKLGVREVLPAAIVASVGAIDKANLVRLGWGTSLAAKAPPAALQAAAASGPNAELMTKLIDTVAAQAGLDPSLRPKQAPSAGDGPAAADALGAAAAAAAVPGDAPQRRNVGLAAMFEQEVAKPEYKPLVDEALDEARRKADAYVDRMYAAYDPAARTLAAIGAWGRRAGAGPAAAAPAAAAADAGEAPGATAAFAWDGEGSLAFKANATGLITGSLVGKVTKSFTDAVASMLSGISTKVGCCRRHRLQVV